MDTVMTAIEHLGIGGLTLALWWLERRERIKLQVKLDKCIERHATDHALLELERELAPSRK